MGGKLKSTITVGIRAAETHLEAAELDPDARIHVQPVLPRPRREMFAELFWFRVPTFAPIHLDTNDVDTQVKGLQHRMSRKLKKAEPNMLKRFESFVNHFCKTKLTPLSEQPDFYEWINNAPYPMERKEELIGVYEALAGAPPTRKQRRKIASFIKSESYYENKQARWINSRSDAFKAWSGPWFKAIEKQVFDLPWFIKHTPVPDRAAKIAALMRHGARYFATDHTAFEAHMVTAFMEVCELRVYDYMLQNFPEIAKNIHSTIGGVNHGATKRGVSFTVKGRRMSGDMCTSLGNGLTNILLWAFLCREKGTIWDGFVEGDDGIFAVYQGTAPTAKDYESLGFELKIDEGLDPRTMSFCGIVAADGQNVRDPAKLLTTFGWTSSCIYGGSKVKLQLLRAKALSTAYETPHCPIIRAIADRALKFTQGAVPRFVDDGYHKLPEDDAPAFAPTAATRSMFAALYGIPVVTQVELEKRIASSSDLSFLGQYFTPHPDSITFDMFYIEKR